MHPFQFPSHMHLLPPYLRLKKRGGGLKNVLLFSAVHDISRIFDHLKFTPVVAAQFFKVRTIPRYISTHACQIWSRSDGRVGKKGIQTDTLQLYIDDEWRMRKRVNHVIKRLSNPPLQNCGRDPCTAGHLLARILCT